LLSAKKAPFLNNFYGQTERLAAIQTELFSELAALKKTELIGTYALAMTQGLGLWTEDGVQ
jgi:hypothetical protein